MRQRGGVPALAVDLQTLHVDVLRAVLRRLDDQLAAVLQVHGDLLEQRGADGVLAAAHHQRVEAERGEQVPGRLLAVVLVAVVALPDLAAGVQPGQHLAHVLLRLPGLPGRVVHVQGVVGHLVGVAVHAHADVPGLGHLVDDTAVGADELRGGRLRGGQVLVELVAEAVPAAVQVGQAAAVLRGGEGVAPAVGLGVVVAPHPRVVLRGLDPPVALGALALEEAGLGVEEVDVVLGAVQEVRGLLLVPLLARLLVEGLAHLRDAVVVEVALQRPRQALVRLGAGVAEERRGRHALAAHTGRRRHDGGVLHRRVVRGLRVEVDTLDVGVRERDVRGGAGHQVGVAGGGPARGPAAVLVVLHEPVDQLTGLGRGQEGVRRPGGAVGVPEAVVDVHLAVDDLRAGVRRGVRLRHPRERRGVLVLPVDLLVARVRVQVQPVQAGVERGQLVRRGALHLDLAEDAVPLALGALLDRLEVAALGDLLAQVVLGLVDADQGGGEAQRDPAVVARVEAQMALDAARVALGDLLVELAVHEHPGRARGQSGLDVRVAGEGAVLLVQGQPGLVGDVVEEHARVVTGEGEAHHRRVVRRRHLGLQAVLEPHTVVVRPRGLVLVPEGQLARLTPEVGGAGGGGRHHLEGLPVAHPGARLVARAERLDRRQVVRVVAARVVVQPAQRPGVGDRGPEVEAVRDGRRGEVVAAREAAAGVGAAGGHRVVGEVGLRPLRRHLLQRHVVQPAPELRLALGRVVRHQDPVDGLAGGHRADPGDHVVPLVDVQDLRRALALRRQREPVLVTGAQVAQVGAVGEGEVDGDVGGVVVEVAVRHRREDAVRQLGVPADGHIDVEHLVVRVRPPLGGVPAGVTQGTLSGEPGARLRRGRAARSAVDQREHVLRYRRLAVAGGELHVGELDQVAAAVLGDLQPEVAVLGDGGGVDVVQLGLEPLGERLAGAGVEGRPLRAVGGALERPVPRVAFGVVVGGGERVAQHLRRRVQGELHPAGGLEGQPLGAGLPVHQVLLHLTAAGVLRARADVGDVVGDIARDAGAVPAVHARGALVAARGRVDRVQPVRGGLPGLERRSELPVGLGRCRRQGDRCALGARGQSEGGRRDDRRPPSVPNPVLHA